MKFAVLCLAALATTFLGGCSSEQPLSNPSSSDSSTPDSSNGANQSNETAFPVPANLTPSLPDSERPTSIEAFKAEFVRRFENDMYAPFLDLAFWGDATDEEKQKYLEGVKHSFSLPSFSHRATVRTSDDVVIPTLSEYGDWAYYPSEGSENVILDPPPTHVMGVTAHFSDDVHVTQHFAVGQRDGTYYFSTIQDTTESANTGDADTTE